jgi:hypothetical protein
MTALDRRARTERAKELGRAAYRLGRDGEIFGNLPVEGEDKQLREYRRGRIYVELWQPWRSDALETEFSRLRVNYSGTRVELRWSRAGKFNMVKFERGEWERLLSS